jgi:hypothetical protein
VARRVKDFIEISDGITLDALIDRLQAVRTSFSANAEPEIRLRGDDVFGHRLTITYFRELTAEEAEREDRYKLAVAPIPTARVELHHLRPHHAQR